MPILHVKFNSRFDQLGNHHCDWYTVGEPATINNIDVTVDSIRVYRDKTAEITAHDADNKTYIITQHSIHQIINEL